MARSNLAGSGANRFNSAAGSAPATAPPFTMACWFKLVDVSVNTQLLLSVRLDSEANNHRFSLFTTASTTKLSSTARDIATGNSHSGNLLSDDTWHYGVAIFTSDTSRRVILDGDWANSGTSTTDITVVGANQIQVGVRSTSTWPVRGEIAEIAMWTAPLSQIETELLATGASPRRIRPSSLVFYCPMRRGNPAGNEVDVIGNVLLTEDGTYGITAHPPDVLLKAGRLLYD